MGRVVTDSKYWRCPSCGEVLEKGGLGVFIFPGDDSGNIIGTATCSKCEAGYSQPDVYGGVYDFVGERAGATQPDQRPSSVNVVLFREGSDPPPEPKRYCEQVVLERYGEPCPEVQEWYLVGWMGQPNAEQAAVAYAANREAGQIPEFGRLADEVETTGPDDRRVAALFFWIA